MRPGAYLIRDLNSKCFYIGSSKNPTKRYEEHKSTLSNGTHQCFNFQKLFNSGPVNLVCIVYETDTIEQAQEMEQQLIRQNLDSPLMLNIGLSAVGGDNLTRNPNRDKIIEKITNTLRKSVELLRKNPEEYRKRFPGLPGPKNGMYGKTHTTEVRKAISLLNTGNKYGLGKKKTLTSEQRLALSERAKQKTGAKNPFFGKKHTAETIEKLRLKNKGSLPPNLKKVMVDSEVYESVTEASRKLGVCVATIIFRIKSSNPKFSGYRYAD